jgi:hypothetical protein
MGERHLKKMTMTSLRVNVKLTVRDLFEKPDRKKYIHCSKLLALVFASIINYCLYS